jgi:hypothetical protein
MNKQKIKKDPYKTCQNIYFSALEKKGNEFNTKKLNEKIISKGGILRLNANYPPKLLIQELVNTGHIKYNLKKEVYEVITPWFA